jgi:hypothetical protein
MAGTSTVCVSHGLHYVGFYTQLKIREPKKQMGKEASHALACNHVQTCMWKPMRSTKHKRIPTSLPMRSNRRIKGEREEGAVEKNSHDHACGGEN